MPHVIGLFVTLLSGSLSHLQRVLHFLCFLRVCASINHFYEFSNCLSGEYNLMLVLGLIVVMTLA